MSIAHATLDSSLRATVLERTPLLYEEGESRSLDRPPHVRAGSGLAWVGSRLAVIQDDANFLALVDPRTKRVRSITLPAGDGGARLFGDDRGNKKAKLDLEACLVLDGALVAFGSGSSPRRERVLVARGLEGGAPDVKVVDAHALYALLRADETFSGSELNVEGATIAGDDVLLFQRGNGAPRNGKPPVDATCRLARAALADFVLGRTKEPPVPREARRYDLGKVAGTKLTFTDAAVRSGRVHYLASAEQSPDATRDGPVVGVALGILDGGAARQTLLRDAKGHPFLAKAEGLAFDPHDPHRAWLVLDLDDPQVPSELVKVELGGPW